MTPYESMGWSFTSDDIPLEILTETFFKYVTGAEWGALLTTSKSWSKIAIDTGLWKKIFDREGLPYFDEVKCKKYRGNPGKVPQISWPRAYQYFNRNCKLFPGKKVKETHKLQLFYKKIDGVPMTLNHAGTLAKNPKEGSEGIAACELALDSLNGPLEAHGETELGASFWGFTAVKSLEGIHEKTIEEKEELVKKYPNYRLHRLVERSIVNFDNLVETGKYLDGEMTSTICEETVEYDDGDGDVCDLPTSMCVTYNDEGLYLDNSYDGKNDGVILLREFY
ncbi:MAG: F-box protein [Verrucomicrobia bacterium]|nr:F-box protein [Verrucomicrobiota bacterium]